MLCQFLFNKIWSWSECKLNTCKASIITPRPNNSHESTSKTRYLENSFSNEIYDSTNETLSIQGLLCLSFFIPLGFHSSLTYSSHRLSRKTKKEIKKKSTPRFNGYNGAQKPYVASEPKSVSVGLEVMI